ncbi:NUMOD1 domain-containing DNA-binding protein [Culicoidibacter larvae]|uniref:Nuclease-associated modular DNA-binding 1 domain-containing protein n=1 Tax=Culicoidibacter larvae TaxID=2579976 RepID=A0A5R8Q8M1_9FIRM|nr:NUMOD1 domain-containing DNA-binding protein [Culicoidibacter larvae]TLG72062.1 hypothetical protein FEZ08_09520 [Culicoidibacter larvae]
MKDKHQETDGEYWFPAYGFPLYECSNTGKVRNVETKRELGRSGKNQVVTLIKVSDSGTITRRNLSLARLVYQSYYKKKVPKGYYVHRMNEINHDNHIANLKLISTSERAKVIGKKRRKPIDHFDSNGEYITTYKSVAEAAKVLHIDRKTVNRIITNKTENKLFNLKKASKRAHIERA